MEDSSDFDLGRLSRRVAGHVTLENKERHDVLQINGRQYRSLENLKPSVAVPRTYEIAAELCPSLTPEQIAELNIEQVQALIGIASAGVAAVRRLYPADPNVESPAAPSSTSPG